jgi:hypothetical protein
VARVRLDENVRRHALSMDPPGKAVADLHAVALSPDEQTIVVSASGTHELLVLKNEQLPWKDFRRQRPPRRGVAEGSQPL